MISSKPCRLTASWIASIGSGAPTMPVTSEPAASSSSGSASSSVSCASVSAWSSGSAKRSTPLDVFGTSNVNRAGPALGALLHGGDQRWGRRGAVGDHENAGGLVGGLHAELLVTRTAGAAGVYGAS